MKKNLCILMVVLVLFSLISCSSVNSKEDDAGLSQEDFILLPEEPADYDSINQKKVIMIEHPAVLDKLGTLVNVYASTDEYGKIVERYWGDGSMKHISYYAEYTDLKPEVLSFFEPRKYGCYKQGEYDLKEDPEKFYIEYIQYTPMTDDRGEYQEVRFFKDPEGSNSSDGWIGKYFSFGAGEDFWDLLGQKTVMPFHEEQKRSSVSIENAGYEPTDIHLRALKNSEYPSTLEKFGCLAGVYAVADENDSIVETIEPERGVKTVSYFAEYTSLDPLIVSSFMTYGYGALFRIYGRSGFSPATLYDRNPSRYYIQLTVDESLSYPDYQEYDVRYLSDPSLIGSGEYFCKCITVDSGSVERVPGSDLYDYICAYRH